MEKRPPGLQGKVTFRLYVHPTESIQRFSHMYRFATPTSLPGKGASSVLQQSED